MFPRGINQCDKAIKISFQFKNITLNATSGYISPGGWGNVNKPLLSGFKNRLTGNLYIKSTYARERTTPSRLKVDVESARCCPTKPL